MDNITIIRIIAGVLFLVVGLAIPIAFIVFLSGILTRCSPQSRTMEPGMVWLLLVPLVSAVWIFFVVIALAKSLGNEFRLRNIPTTDYEPGKSIGIGMAVCGACSVIPFVNLLAAPAALVLLIVYWAKMAGNSKMLDSVPSMIPAPAPGV